MQDIRALTGLKTKPLPKELSHVGLIVHDQDAHAHDAAAALVGWEVRGNRTVNSVKSPTWLSISYDIVTQQHGGTITVDSQVGDFTEFTVRLPRTSQPTRAAAAS